MAEAVVAQMIFSVWQGMEAKKDSKKAAAEQESIARQNAANIEAENAEQQRRAAEQEGEVSAERRARSAASGVGKGGSQESFIQAEADEFDKQMAWLTKSGQAQSDLTIKQGQSAAANTRRQGDAALWGGITSAATAAASYGGWGGSTTANPSVAQRTAVPMGTSGYGKASWASP